jgi:hypothetical protein
MRYFQYPVNGIGVHQETYDEDHPGFTLGGDLKGGSYQWYDMSLVIDCDTITEAQQLQIGRLAWDAAISIHTLFAADGSSGNYPESALLNVFQYSNAIEGRNGGKNIPEQYLYAMVNPNLDARLPVILSIHSSSDGHEVVCDGYGYDAGTIYHHLNMGWGGDDDTWYNLPTIDTSDNGDYTTVTHCAYNIYTWGTGEIISGRVTDSDGNTIFGAQVTLMDSNGAPIRTVSTDNNGIYAFPHTPSMSIYYISVADQYHTFPGRQSVGVGTSTSGGIKVANVWGKDFVAAAKIPPTISLSSNLNPSNYTQSVKFTASLTGAGGSPTGTVTFMADYGTARESIIGTPTVANGVASVSTSSLAPGNHVIAALYGGDKIYQSGSCTLPNGQTVNQATTTTNVTSTYDPTFYGQPATFTAKVTAQYGGTPTGTVTFLDGNSTIGTGTLSGGSTTFTTSTPLSLGTHTIKAKYNGDNNFKTSSGTLRGGQTVNQAPTEVIIIPSRKPPIFYGQRIDFTVYVSAPYGGTPAGTVRIAVGGTNYGPLTLSSQGSAEVVLGGLPVGDYPVTASYSGDGNFQANTGSISPDLIVKPAPTNVSVTSTAEHSDYDQSITFTAAVTGKYGGTPTGAVQFTVDGNDLGGSVTLSGGSAKSQTISSLSSGNHSVSACFNSSDKNFESGCGALTQTVGKVSSVTKVLSSKDPSVLTDSVTFTATVTGQDGTATGSVQFVVGETKFGLVTLSGGVATLQWDPARYECGVGNYPVTASYSGDSHFDSSSGTLPGGQTVLKSVVQTYITDWGVNKSGNIFMNLNEEFPNTGLPPKPKTFPQTHMYLFDPANYSILKDVPTQILESGSGYVSGSDLASNGIKFKLTSDTKGRDFLEIDSGVTITIKVPVSGATSVYLLMSSYNGEYADVRITGDNGHTAYFPGVWLPDFNGGAGSGGINQSYGPSYSKAKLEGTLLAQTVLIVNDKGAGGTGHSATGDVNNYNLTELSFSIAGAQMAGSGISSVSITSGNHVALLLGVTAR